MENGTIYSTVLVQALAGTGIQWSCVARGVQGTPEQKSDVAFEPPPPSL
jgi:hypothetical protein